jgi:hypothetical protein
LSRLASSRGSSAPAASSRSAAPAARRPGVLVQSPKSDIYVVLLGISVGAIVISCILMLILFSRYEFKTKAASLSPPVSATAIA